MITLADMTGSNKDPWMAKAACRHATDPELFFPDRGRHDIERLAKRICGDCPVVQACLDDALTHSLQYGVRGGLTAKERRAILRNQKKPTPGRGCGTQYGANLHYKRGEPPCTACREADNARRREQRRQRKKALA